MLTAPQYEVANAHRTVIKFVAEGGGGHNFPIEIYRLKEDMGIGSVDLTCNGCKIEWIKDLYNYLIEYDNGKG